MAPGATLKTSKSAPVTPTASSTPKEKEEAPKNELFSKLSEKSPIIAAVITTAFATNPALKSARSCMGPSCAGFRDFLLRGTVVDMAVAIVLGLAFMELIKAFISCLVTPLFAAIWKKQRFADTKWVVRGSELAIGKFVNTLLAFVLVCLILYYCIVVPMIALTEATNPKDSRRPCPKCLEDIAAGAERCPHCTAVVPIAAHLQARMDADVTGEIQADLDGVRNNTSYFDTLKSWIPGAGPK
jgi:large conductance mechanosensitive channel